MWIQSLQLNLFSGYTDTFDFAEADSWSWAEAASVFLGNLSTVWILSF